jgi:hypothetical protein
VYSALNLRYGQSGEQKIKKDSIFSKFLILNGNEYKIF